MALNDRIPSSTPGGIDARVALISQAMHLFIVLCVVVAVVLLSLRGDMDKATTGSLLGIVLGHTGTAVAQNFRGRQSDHSIQSGD